MASYFIVTRAGVVLYPEATPAQAASLVAGYPAATAALEALEPGGHVELGDTPAYGALIVRNLERAPVFELELVAEQPEQPRLFLVA